MTTLRTQIEAFSATGGFLKLNKRLLDLFGAERAIYISNLIDALNYFLSRGALKDEEWFYLTHEEQLKKIKISSKKRFLQYKKEFKKLGVIETKMMGVPAKEFYKIDLDKLDSLLESGDVAFDANDTLASDTGKRLESDTGKRHNKDYIHQDYIRQKESKDSYNTGSPQEPKPKKSSRTKRVSQTQSQTHANDEHANNEHEGAHTQKEKVVNDKPKKIPHETQDNLRVFRFWNEMSNTTKHRKGTKTYKRALKKIYQLRMGKLNVKDPRDNGIPHEWYSTPWKLKDIYRAIRNLNEMFYEGVWPKNKDNLPHSLPDAILNHNKTSWLMIAYKFGAQEINDPLAGKDEYTLKLYERLLKGLNHIRSKELPDNKKADVVTVAENIQKFYASIPRNAPLSHEIINEFPNSGSVVTAYTKFLAKEKHELIDMGPRGIDVGNHVWNEFIKSWESYLGVSFSSGT